MNAPPEAIRPLKDRLEVLKAHRQQNPDPKLAESIAQLESLIRRLENPNAPRNP